MTLKSLRLCIIITLALLTPALTTFANSNTTIDSLPEYSQKYDPARNAFADGRQAINLAKQSNRRVLIIVGGNWCQWCRAMDKFIKTTPSVYKNLHQHFVILKINVSDKNKNKKFLSAFPKAHGYPHLFVANHNGSVLRSQATNMLQENGKYSEKRFLEFISRWKQKASNPDFAQRTPGKKE